MTKKYIVILLTSLCSIAAFAQQRFFNLTAEQVKVDSLLPHFGYTVPLNGAYTDSLYEVNIRYPEFIAMSKADAARLKQLGVGELPALPEITSRVVVDRRRGGLRVSFLPFVYRDGKYQKLVSFMLDVQSRAKQPHRAAQVESRAADVSARYAGHSVLAAGSWAKIRVPETGVYQLTDALIRRAGFTNLSRVKVYGYGGALQNEVLYGDELAETDDLAEVPTCTVGGRRLFYAQGPVYWSSRTSMDRTRNPYSDYGYYFITQDDAGEEPLQMDSATFVASFYPGNEFYHSLHEIDNYAWFEGGRNLFEETPVNAGSSATYTLEAPADASVGRIAVSVTSPVKGATVNVEVNDSAVGLIRVVLTETSKEQYLSGLRQTAIYTVRNLRASNTVKLTVSDGGPMRLDYIDMWFNTPLPAPSLVSSSIPSPEYVYNITNQDLHADENYQMVIIIPASQKLRAQAERLKAFHEEHDGMRVRLLPADELYNEFSSGTPDANAYRRYLKMLYDKAETEAQMPRYLLLFGDCAWDNRMNSSAWRGYRPDDFLLCYESDNSFSKVDCYVDDGFFCYLDDGEGEDPKASDLLDVAVGRFPVRTADEAKVMVDKTINYMLNANAGEWQNTVMVMGDDGNNNTHMLTANSMGDIVESLLPGTMVKRVMWDTYSLVKTSTGKSYPEVTAIVKQQQNKGALIMNYCGHGAETSISHEKVLMLQDFKDFSNKNLPLWITASCDIMPFDSQMENIGEEAVLNKKGGAVAFFGTTRTVYADRNRNINKAFLRSLLTPVDGKHVSIGEAQRLAKNYLVMPDPKQNDGDATLNKLQYSLLGDPALVLQFPQYGVYVDSINGINLQTTEEWPTLKAGSIATVSGYVGSRNVADESFDGTLSATVRDSKELIVGRLNDTSDEGASSAIEYSDYTKVLFNGQNSVRKGRFSFSFAVPKDINYSNNNGIVNLFALRSDLSDARNGFCDEFFVGGTAQAANDSIGPSIFCYLNSPQFVDGGNVNTTPYFVAKITDKDGLNTTGNGIGHNLELVIDGEMTRTYVLNDNFEFDFGSYTSGSTYYSIPELAVGHHKLRFRAWDILNNSSTAELTFNVVRALEPNCLDVSVTENPARDATSFIINHDRAGSNLDIEIDVFDMSGRRLWNYAEAGVAASSTYTVDWNLTVDSGQKLQTGVYLYRVRLSSDGSKASSKAKKLIVVSR